MKRRVVITGLGIWSSIGIDLNTVSKNLREGRSGIVYDEARQELGIKCPYVGNVPTVNLRGYLSISQRRTMLNDVQYAYMATKFALEDASIDDSYLKKNVVGVVVGYDGSMDGALDVVRTMDLFKDPIMLGPSSFFRWATSSPSMNLSSLFNLRGVSLSTGAACASSIHALGVASLYIRAGLQDVIVVGGCADPSCWSTVVADALSVLATSEQQPQLASCPFDEEHNGMVPSGGAAILVLEEYNHAVERGARIYAELVGYGCSTNGLDNLSSPDSDGELRAMECALDDAALSIDDIDYICAHATSTIVGDRAEAIALNRLLNGRQIPIGSTKSMTGHENWMAGASETIYSLLMMRDDFVAPTINVKNKIPEAENLYIPSVAIEKKLKFVMNNSFGLGGTNGCIILKKI